jgi:hypothetical protein
MVAKMKIEQAHKLLDKVKDGNCIATIIEITQALWQTGDLRVSQNLTPFDLDGINARREKIRMGQSAET